MTTNSKLSIASFIVSIFLTIIFFTTIICSYLFRFDFPQSLSNETSLAIVVLTIGYIMICLVVLSVNIALLAKNDSSKWIPAAGIIMQGVTFIGMAAIAMWSKSFTTEIAGVTILEHGRYHATITDSIITGDSTQKKINLLSNITLIENTNTITASIGLSFGFRYIIAGFPPGRRVPVRLVNNYPSPGLKNPETGFTSTSFSRTYSRAIGDTIYTGFSFEYPWETVSGEWTWQIWVDEKKLAEKTFIVVPE